MAYLPTVRSFVDICGVSRTSIHLPGGMTPAMGYPDFQLPRTDASGHFHRSGVAMTNVSHRKWTILDVNTCSVPPPQKKTLRYSGFRNLALLGEMLSGKWSILWGWLWQQFPTGYIYIYWYIWGFLQMAVPTNGLFIMKNPIKVDDLGIPLFWETSMCAIVWMISY